MTKEKAVKVFKELFTNFRNELKVDRIAVALCWDDFTDTLCKDGEITEGQYNRWSNPWR